MSITTREALEAYENLAYIVSHWADLRARLQPGGGNALTGMPGGGSARPLPIDVEISDLMFAIEQEARTLGHVLLDETTDWQPRTSRMPALLLDVAERYGHWTAGDERTALAFCDWATEYAGKVRRALERPAPPNYLGPCREKGEDGAGCAGEIYLREGIDAGRCRECGADVTREDQVTYVQTELEARLMTPTEIVRALKVLGHEVKPGTVHKWVERGKLAPLEPGERLFRLTDAMALMRRGEKISA